MADPRPIGVFDSGVGGLTVLREILRRTPARVDPLPRRQRPRAVRRPLRRRGRRVQPPGARHARVARRQGHRRRLQHLDRGRPGRPARGATTCRSWASSGRGPPRRRWRPARAGSASSPRPATVRSHAYFKAIKDENPAVEVYEHATPTLVPLVEAGQPDRAGAPRPRSPRRSRRSSASRDAAGEFIFPLPPSARIDTLLLGCTHYPLLRPVIAALVGRAGRDRRLRDCHRVRARRAACRSTGSRHPVRDAPRGSAADRRAAAGHEPPASAAEPRRRAIASSRPATSTRSARSPVACSATRSRTSRRSSCEVRA